MSDCDNMQQRSALPEIEQRVTRPVELFALSDLAGLRDELRRAGLDTWQTAEMIGNFLTQRGYGVSHHACRSEAQEDVVCGSYDRMQAGLAALAVLM